MFRWRSAVGNDEGPEPQQSEVVDVAAAKRLKSEHDNRG